MHAGNGVGSRWRSAGWRRAALAACAAAALVAGSPAHADAVTHWNELADKYATGGPPVRGRTIAMAQIAVHDALNAISARYERYAYAGTAPAGAQVEAAVAAAAYGVLNAISPSAALTNDYNGYMLAVPACPPARPQCVGDGTAVGTLAAQAILVLRTGDGSATPNLPAYAVPPGIGVYEPTPQPSGPQYGPAQFTGWGRVTPFAMNSASQFRPGPGEIFDLTSEAYTRDFNEVKAVGRNVGSTRTADQSEIARFWPPFGSNGNLVARTIVTGRGLDPWEHARLFALLNIAIADSAISVFDTKYAYNFWRPVTAIRAAADDGNPDTQPDPQWLSFQVTPPYPDYTCGLTNATGAFMEVLRRYFRTDALPYTLVPPSTAGLQARSFATLSDAEDEAVDARVFGGMHFRSGCRRGVIQGNQVGRFAFQHYLRPLRGKDAN